MAQLDLRLDGVKVKRFEVPEGNNPPQATGVTISGPYNITGPGDTPSRARIFVCRPAAAKDEEPCARKILAERRAPRVPPSRDRRRPQAAAGFYRSGRERAGFRLRHREGAARHAGFARFPVPHRARPAGQRARQRVPHQRFRTGVAALVLPVEQHSRRRAAGSGREGQAEGPGRAGPAGTPHAGRSARRNRW